MEALTQGVYNNATEQVNKVQLESLMTLLNLKIELVVYSGCQQPGGEDRLQRPTLHC